MIYLKTLFFICASALIFGLGAVPAIAGEVTGNGKDIDVNGRSICAFSGQNDGNPPPGRTQSFGQNVSNDRLDPRNFDPDFEGPFHPYPGWACNPNNVDLHEGN
ncbi:MAG: hypothetical protein ABIR25_00740 [Sphingomicrobium sp.]